MFVKLFIILKFKLYNKCQKRFEIRVHELILENERLKKVSYHATRQTFMNILKL